MERKIITIRNVINLNSCIKDIFHNQIIIKTHISSPVITVCLVEQVRLRKAGCLLRIMRFIPIFAGQNNIYNKI